MSHHLEVLREVLRRRLRVVESMRKAKTLNRRLRDALDVRRGFDAQSLENRRHHINGVRILRAHFTLRFDPLRPVDDERIADAAAVGLALPAAERRVARKCPAPGVVIEDLGTAELVECGARFSSSESVHVVEELVFVN